jgi:hypothetical protein
LSRASDIGGYLGFERFGGKAYHEDAIALNCGRSCLEYILELRGITTIWLPDWICDAVHAVCRRSGAVVKTYSIGTTLRPTYDFVVADDEWLYLVDYYGQLQEKDIDCAFQASAGRLIVDEAQGFYRKPWKKADTLYTCRKFFGVADGGYLHTSDGTLLRRDLPMSKSGDHMRFVLGRYEGAAGEFYEEASLNNERFNSQPLSQMSPVTENILRAIDYEKTRERREENFAFLHNYFKERNRLAVLLQPEGPYMYPLLVSSVGRSREILAKRGVYIPVLWPNVLNSGLAPDSVARRYSKNILPLPVDQRYGEEEMAFICECMNDLEKNENGITFVEG